MGSTGTGHFTDYPGNLNSIKGVVGPEPKEDRCERAFSAELEDIQTSDYYKKYGKVPTPGAYVSIGWNRRIIAMDEDGLTIGNLPTRFNYLLACLNDGFSYTGAVEESHDLGLPYVKIAVTPTRI